MRESGIYKKLILDFIHGAILSALCQYKSYCRVDGDIPGSFCDGNSEVVTEVSELNKTRTLFWRHS